MPKSGNFSPAFLGSLTPAVTKLVHKDFDISEIQELSINELKTEASKLREEVKKLRLERDILEKATEIIKKGQGIKISNLSNKEKIKVIQPKIKKYSSYVGEISPVVPNLLKRNFKTDRPNKKWLTDITEFHIPAGKIYLSPLLDCYDGLVVAWTIGLSPGAELANTMLKDGISILKPGKKPIVHSDRGFHYRTKSWIKMMEKAGLTRSMSKKVD